MVMFSKQLLPAIGKLNTAFSIDGIQQVQAHRDRFRTGSPLPDALGGLLGDDDAPETGVFKQFIARMPGSFQESIRSIILYCLDSDPPVLLNVAWAPGYDYEMSIWETVEPPPFMSGVTLVLKTRYPEDPLPYAGSTAA